MRRTALQTSDIASDVLKCVRASDGISRVDLARELGMAPSTVGIYVERLIAERYLVETEKNSREAGRPPRILRPDSEGGEFIGVDFEARNVMAVAVDFSDRPQRNARRQIEAGDTASEVIAKIEEAIAEVLPEGGSRLLAIGVGVPGLVDSTRGIALLYKYIAQWREVPLAATLSKRFRVPVFLENNARAMALAELWFGQGRGERDFLCVGIRSGIGAGLILDGRLYCGAHYAAGELGRWRCPTVSPGAASWFEAVGAADPEGPELQDIASVRALQKAIQKAASRDRKTVLPARKTAISLAEIVDAAQQRDALTVRVAAEAAGAMGWAIGHLALVTDPAKVVLAGPLTSLGEMFLEPVRSRVARILAPSGLRPPEIVNSTMGEFSGALGAAALALHEWKPGIEDSGQAAEPGRKLRGRAAGKRG